MSLQTRASFWTCERNLIGNVENSLTFKKGSPDNLSKKIVHAARNNYLMDLTFSDFVVAV